jgi:hypothetical protein
MILRGRPLRSLATGAMVLAFMTGATGVASAALPQASAKRPTFSGQCWSGIDSWGNGHWAWGACTGYGTFRLHASCTWGQNKTSAPVAVNGGNSRIDVECPYGTSVRSTYIET